MMGSRLADKQWPMVQHCALLQRAADALAWVLLVVLLGMWLQLAGAATWPAVHMWWQTYSR